MGYNSNTFGKDDKAAKASKSLAKPKDKMSPVQPRMEDKDSWLENLAEIIDPTGLSSYDDVYRSYKNTGFSGETALEAFGALPLIGKIGKSGKIITGGFKALQNTVKAAQYLPPKAQQKVLDKAYKAYGDYVKAGGKEFDEVLGAGTKSIVDATPYLNPTKWKSSDKAINTLNKSHSLGKGTNAVQTLLGSKDDSGFQWDMRHGITPSYNGRSIFPDMQAQSDLDDGYFDYKRGGQHKRLPYNKQNETHYNIQSSINKLMARNTTLFGPAGRKFYNPLSKFGPGGTNPPTGTPSVPPNNMSTQDYENQLWDDYTKEWYEIDQYNKNVIKEAEAALDPEYAKKVFKHVLPETMPGVENYHPFYCSTRSCEIERAAGATLPYDITFNKVNYKAGDKVPIIPGTQQWSGNAEKMGWKKIKPKDAKPGDRIFAVDSTGTTKHSVLMSPDKNKKGTPLFYGDHGDGSSFRKDVSYWGNPGTGPAQIAYTRVGRLPELENKLKSLPVQEMSRIQANFPQAPEPELIYPSNYLQNIATKKYGGDSGATGWLDEYGPGGSKKKEPKPPVEEQRIVKYTDKGLYDKAARAEADSMDLHVINERINQYKLKHLKEGVALTTKEKVEKLKEEWKNKPFYNFAEHVKKEDEKNKVTKPIKEYVYDYNNDVNGLAKLDTDTWKKNYKPIKGTEKSKETVQKDGKIKRTYYDKEGNKQLTYHIVDPISGTVRAYHGDKKREDDLFAVVNPNIHSASTDYYSYPELKKNKAFDIKNMGVMNYYENNKLVKTEKLGDKLSEYENYNTGSTEILHWKKPVIHNVYEEPPIPSQKSEPTKQVIQQDTTNTQAPILTKTQEPKYAKRQWLSDGTGDTYQYLDNTGKELGRETYQKGKLVTPAWYENNIMNSKDNVKKKNGGWLDEYQPGGQNYGDDYSKSRANMNMLELSQNTAAPKKAFKFNPKALPHAPANMQEAQQLVDAQEKHQAEITAAERLAYSRMTKAQKEKYDAAKEKERYVNNPGFMDYASQLGHIPLLAMSNPFNMGEKLKELRAIKVNDNLSSWQKFDQMGNVGTEATTNALLNALTEGLAEGLLPGAIDKLSKLGKKEKLIDLYRIQEKGGKPFAELAREGKIPQAFNNAETIARKTAEEKHFGQWFTKDKADLDWYAKDREFTNPEIIKLKVPESKLSSYQNYDNSLSRAPEREFVIPHEEQTLYKEVPKVLPKGAHDVVNSAGFNPDVISNTLWHGYLPKLRSDDLPKGGFFRKIGSEEGLKDLIQSGEARLPPGQKNFTGTPGVYFSKNAPIEDYSGRFVIHHPGDGEIKTYFDGIQDQKFMVPSDKKYPRAITPVRLDDPRTTIYKRGFMNTRYKKVDKDKLNEAMENIKKYENLEKILKMGVRYGSRAALTKGALDWLNGEHPEYVPYPLSQKKKGGQVNWLDNYR